MTAITWQPGTKPELDDLFDTLREKQCQDRSHPKHLNYTPENFAECAALTIAFDAAHEPLFCASITARSCWPDHVYRIANRFWKVNHAAAALKNFSSTGLSVITSQIEWLNTHTQAELYFISRESYNWRTFAQQQLARHLGLDFASTDHKYLTCADTECQGCWQYILYQGRTELLTQWKRK